MTRKLVDLDSENGAFDDNYCTNGCNSSWSPISRPSTVVSSLKDYRIISANVACSAWIKSLSRESARYWSIQFLQKAVFLFSKSQ